MTTGGFGCMLLINNFANEVSVGYRTFTILAMSWHFKHFLNKWKCLRLDFLKSEEKMSAADTNLANSVSSTFLFIMRYSETNKNQHTEKGEGINGF